jgi:hypothetical protein
MEEEKDLIDEEPMLCFIRLVGEENDGIYRYEFIFTDNIDEVFGEDFDQKPACLVNNLMVSDEYISEIHIVRMKIKLELAQDSCCFAMSDFYDGICALGYEDISGYDSYPEEGRLFFFFGETLSEVERRLAIKHIIMVDNNLLSK